MRLEILIGMIASGKSIYARKRADEGALVVCHDDLTQMLHGGVYRYKQELRDCYRTMEEQLALTALLHGRDVVIDRTHLTLESRERWCCFRIKAQDRLDTFLKRLDVLAVVFPMQDAVIHGLRRFETDARGRDQMKWLEIAEHHADQWLKEPLSEDEGFDEIVRMP